MGILQGVEFVPVHSYELRARKSPTKNVALNASDKKRNSTKKRRVKKITYPKKRAQKEVLGADQSTSRKRQKRTSVKITKKLFVESDQPLSIVPKNTDNQDHVQNDFYATPPLFKELESRTLIINQHNEITAHGTEKLSANNLKMPDPVQPHEICKNPLEKSSVLHNETKKLDNCIGFQTGYISRKGDREENQDYYLIPLSSQFSLEDSVVPLWGVCDGHGPLGASCSKNAATLISNGVRGIQTKAKNNELEPPDHGIPPVSDVEQVTLCLDHIISHSNEELICTAKKSRQEYGTTCCLAVLFWQHTTPTLVLANVGDSRAVFFSKAQSDLPDISNNSVPLSYAIKCQTIDHKLSREDEVNRIKSAGGTVMPGSAGFLRVVPNLQEHPLESVIKNKWALNMSRSLGHPLLSNYGVSGKAEFYNSQVNPGDFLVIASDGLWEAMSTEEVLQLVLSKPSADPTTLCREMAKVVQSRSDTKGTPSDNHTIVLVVFK